MNRRNWIVLASLLVIALPYARGAEPAESDFQRAVRLYKAGRNSDAIDAFDLAIKRKENVDEAQAYNTRIRNEIVERVRNKALTGVDKSKWQSKFYFMNELDKRINIGISEQEVFERDSLNFRPGAVDALNRLAAALTKADKSHLEIDLVSEINQAESADRALKSLRLIEVFSYLSLAAGGSLPNF